MILNRDRSEWSAICGVDPGETTGLAAIELGSGLRLSQRIGSGRSFLGQIPLVQGDRHVPWYMSETAIQKVIAGRLAALAEQWSLTVLHLAIEDFIIRERTQDRNLLSPVRMTSGILAYLHEFDDVNVVVHLNSAADAKGAVTDEMLKKVGLYRPGYPHANDAARQAVLVLRKEGK